ncbi:MAG: hypothetical protein VW270_21805 [Candidatus Poseidoniales archaeon]
MEKYKIVSILVDALNKEEVEETLAQMKQQQPELQLDVLKYNWSTVEKRYGRDPDLH